MVALTAMSAGCPCLTSLAGYNLTGATGNAGGYTFNAFRPGSLYGEFYGLGCNRHDEHHAPFCHLPNSPSYCSDAWCWVDPDVCDRTFGEHPSLYFTSTGLHYSYETCNNTNTFDSFYTTGSVHLCSVFSLSSAQTSEVTGENPIICGNTNTKAQVESTISAINALNGGRGFMLPHAGQLLA